MSCEHMSVSNLEFANLSNNYFIFFTEVIDDKKTIKIAHTKYLNDIKSEFDGQVYFEDGTNLGFVEFEECFNTNFEVLKCCKKHTEITTRYKEKYGNLVMTAYTTNEFDKQAIMILCALSTYIEILKMCCIESYICDEHRRKYNNSKYLDQIDDSLKKLSLQRDNIMKDISGAFVEVRHKMESIKSLYEPGGVEMEIYMTIDSIIKKLDKGAFNNHSKILDLVHSMIKKILSPYSELKKQVII